jgi:hypothetical protein
MAIVQISRIQIRRGLKQDLPNLASGEFGWSIDTRQLYIGNGTLIEGAPLVGRTEILTEFSSLIDVDTTYTFQNFTSGIVAQTGPTTISPVRRSLQDKFDDIASVKDYGAIGDGVADDTAAIQRALDKTWATAEGSLALKHHKTIWFPAGQYRITGTINIPPYTKMQGEGEANTTILGTFAAPLAQFTDQLGQTGIFIGNGGSIAEEYHVADMTFSHENLFYNQSCFVIDGGISATFNRVSFTGLLAWTTSDGIPLGVNGYYNNNYGTGIAAVKISNSSTYTTVRDIQFSQCSFKQQNYGIEINNNVTGVSITQSNFDRLYHAIVIGNNSGASKPAGISIASNYFRYTAQETIATFASVSQINCNSNYFDYPGVWDYESANRVVNTTGFGNVSVISFNADNNYSIADKINPLSTAYPAVQAVPTIQTNGYNCYLIQQDVGLVNGRLTIAYGKTVTLADSPTFTAAGITYAPGGWTNLTMNYTVRHATAQRVGTLRVANYNGVYAWDEDYNETSDALFYFRVNTVTGIIEYISTAIGAQAVLTYNLQYFN